MIDYLLFDNTKWDVNLLKNLIIYSKPNLRYGHFKMQQVLYIVFYSSNTCKNRNLKSTLKLLYMIDYLLFNETKWVVNLLKNSIMYSTIKLRYGHFKTQQVLYIVFYSSNTCKNRNLVNYFKIVVHYLLFFF